MSADLLKAVICMVAIVSSQAMADLVIDLIDGERIVVPVDNSKVKSIGFENPAGEKTPASVVRNAKGTAVDTRSQGAKVWRVGAGRALRYPSEAARKARLAASP